jgi:hypothetical protein
VTRHNVTTTDFDKSVPRTEQTPLRIGNGHFPFSLDVTALQTLLLQGRLSHSTLPNEGWHTAANPENCRPEETMTEVTAGDGGKAPYAAKSRRHWPKLSPEQENWAEGAWDS